MLKFIEGFESCKSDQKDNETKLKQSLLGILKAHLVFVENVPNGRVVEAFFRVVDSDVAIEFKDLASYDSEAVDKVWGVFLILLSPIFKGKSIRHFLWNSSFVKCLSDSIRPSVSCLPMISVWRIVEDERDRISNRILEFYGNIHGVYVPIDWPRKSHIEWGVLVIVLPFVWDPPHRLQTLLISLTLPEFVDVEDDSWLTLKRESIRGEDHETIEAKVGKCSWDRMLQSIIKFGSFENLQVIAFFASPLMKIFRSGAKLFIRILPWQQAFHVVQVKLLYLFMVIIRLWTLLHDLKVILWVPFLSEESLLEIACSFKLMNFVCMVIDFSATRKV